ncbi:MAG: phenylalanyl-tRNA synthetase alpha chain [Archaeoglobi archaeon]|nr:phenylalanyl-tRNA synthetase alpha chain [Archaeoglobi archaeon]MDK2781091.1 phenylalanyl-tRNA synthetase alpha chain [Archaeoglobi archaeon]
MEEMMRILNFLKEKGESTLKEISKELGKSEAEVMSSLLSLHHREFIELEKEELIYCRLSEEGREYAEKGLPERRVFEFLLSKGGEASLKEIREKFGEKLTSIALGWLRKKGWVEFIKGEEPKIRALKAERGNDEEVLERLLKKELRADEVDGRTLEELKKRGLVELEERRIHRVRITEKGRKAKPEDFEEITRLTPEIILSGEWRRKKIKKYDIHAPVSEIFPAKIHPYRRIIEEMRRIFLSMGFTEIRGEIVQSSFWNFDALFQPQDHPAREMQDTFYLESESELDERLVKRVKAMHEHGGEIDSTGWGFPWREELARKNVLRTHTTAITIRYLAENPEPPVKAFCIDRVYRRETVDSTHLPEFDQLEGVVMERGMSLSNLFGVLKTFYNLMGFRNVRFRPGYFPYTEPSVECEVYVDGLGWIELGGAGIFRKEVTEPLGIKYPVLAWGLGVSRLAMLKLNLKDLRYLYRPDIEWLRRVPICP